MYVSFRYVLQIIKITRQITFDNGNIVLFLYRGDHKFFLLLLFPSPKWYLVYLHVNKRKNQYGDRIAEDHPILSSELRVSFTIGKC